jgi:hypothetical protein
VLLIDSVNVLVIVVGVGQELHKPPPERVAPTKVKSPDVHDVPGGGYDCANEAEILSKLNIKNTNNFFEKVNFVFIQLNLVEYFIDKLDFGHEVV